MIVKKANAFLDERLGTNAFLRVALSKIFPDHWSFYLGEFSLYTFMILVMTGIWLTFVYIPTPTAAYASVSALTREHPIGYLIRQIHHWSAVVFIAAIVVHMGRIFFTAAFRKPRELNWVIGFTMLILASLTGFTGYSLPNDSLSGVGLRIADSVVLQLPLIGAWASHVLNGGEYPGPLLLPHLYTIHVYFLPISIAALLGAHLFFVIYQKHTQFEKDETKVIGRRMWPDYALRAIAAMLCTVAVIVLISSLVEINPVQNYGIYHDWSAPNPATPDWYAAFLDGALRLGPSLELNIFGHRLSPLFWPAVVMPTIVLTIILLWPWIDKRISGDQSSHDVLVPPTQAPWRTGVGVAFIAAGVILTFAASDDQQAYIMHLDVRNLVWFYRIFLPVGSIGAGLLAAKFAAELAARTSQPSEPVVALRRSADGGFTEEVVEEE